jgi:hypothetical protein
VAKLLEESLSALRVDVPACHQAARLAFVGKEARCWIEREAFVVGFTNDDIVLRKPTEGAAVEVNVSRQAILALIRNHRSLHSSVRSGELRIQGLINDVASLGRAMKAFLHGAVRSPAFPPILMRFEALVEGGREERE